MFAGYVSKETQLAMTCNMLGTIFAGALVPGGVSGEVNAIHRLTCVQAR